MATDINGTALAVRDETTRDIASIDLTAIERVIVAGDLAKLSPDQRWDYYQGVCRSMGLNPFTKPFEYITLNGKLTLYALKGCTDQLRRVYGVSLTQPSIQFDGGLCIVTITGRDKTDRTDTDIGAVNVEGLKGEARANAVMKAITKGKRRVTLSLCGLGMLDETETETETETIPNARTVSVEEAHGIGQQQAATESPDRETMVRWFRWLQGVADERGHEERELILKMAPEEMADDKLAKNYGALRRCFPDIPDETLREWDNEANELADNETQAEAV